MNRFAVFAALALMAAPLSAFAAPPAEVQVKDGVYEDQQGLPLYTFDNDTMVGMSHCSGGCATHWPPLAAPAGAKPSGDWTVINREDGTAQWAYKSKPLYTFAADKAGEAPKGDNLGQKWHLAKP
jgi:predicted lipoprotein with Yx(FWY)xxD motif